MVKYVQKTTKTNFKKKVKLIQDILDMTEYWINKCL